MDIYVVQDGDTITSIANQFGVTETKLILDNGITNPYDLVIGQTIVITYPQKTYLVQDGDTLSEIAFNNGISMMQLFRNNPYLWDREFIYPGEVLIINYNTKASVTTNAYAFPFIDKNIAKKSLPYLTYLSILNYKTSKQGEIESFYDDSDLIATAKYFGVAPLMLVTSVTFRGERNPELVNDILLNPDYQDRHAQNMLKIMKEKGYYGVNITITYLNKDNQKLYIEYLKRITSHLNKEGFPVFVTIDPNFMSEENELLFEKVNYSNYNELVDLTYVMRFFWGTQFGPPMPVSSVRDISIYVNYMKQTIAPQKINIGFPLLGYDWEIPYIEGFTKGNAITLDTAVELARITKSTILFDEISETPYYEYNIGKNTAQHMVWFVDARTIYAIAQLVIENGLQGTGLWNIMTYYPQLWLIINSNFTIEKILPEISSDSL